MKHLLRFSFLALAMVLIAQPSSALVFPTTVEPVKANVSPSPFAGMTVKDFLALTPKKYKELTGKRMTNPQKVSLKLAQYKVKKMVKQNKQVDLYKFTPAIDDSDFSIGGLVLGLLLGIIGVLIAYLIGDSAVVKWAWIGFAIWVGIVLLAILL